MKRQLLLLTRRIKRRILHLCEERHRVSTEHLFSHNRKFKPVILAPADHLGAKLPLNAICLEDLSSASLPYGNSPRSTPGSPISAVVLGNLGPTHIEGRADQWGNWSYSLYTDNGHAIKLEGTAWNTKHKAAASKKHEFEPIETGAWILHHHFGNYFHWVVHCLPKAAFLSRLGYGNNILLPRGFAQRPFISASLRLVGVDPEKTIELPPSGAACLNTLAIQGGVKTGGSFSPKIMRTTRDIVCGSLPENSAQAEACPLFLYISRADSKWRRILNENEVIELVTAQGFTVMELSGLSFTDQVNFFQRTQIFITAHGAALANMMWMPKESHVVEIIPGSFPFEKYYALALALGHNYWSCQATFLQEHIPPNKRDMSADLRCLASIIERIKLLRQTACPRPS